MTRINLRDFYPFYDSDCFIDVPDEFAGLLQQWKRDDKSYMRKLYRHKAHFSLDYGDDIEFRALFVSCSPEERYERILTRERLWAAIEALPAKQGNRIYAHFFLGMSKVEIAKAEGVAPSTVRDSISNGLKNMEIYLKKYF